MLFVCSLVLGLMIGMVVFAGMLAVERWVAKGPKGNVGAHWPLPSRMNPAAPQRGPLEERG